MPPECALGRPETFPGPALFIPGAEETGGQKYFLLRSQALQGCFTSTEIVLESRQSRVRIRFDGANPAVQVEGAGPLPTRANFLLGQQRARQRTDIATFRSVIYRQLYPGIDVVYDGHEHYLKSEFQVAPGADPALIRIHYDGVEEPQVAPDGALLLTASGGVLREEPPLIYQESSHGRIQVAGRYHVFADRAVGFRVDDYDRKLPLIIDPVIGFSTYFGGSAFDSITSIAVDAAGNSYIAGWTESLNIPVVSARQGASGGRIDAFVAKLSPAGTLVYATYIGGSGDDRAFGIAVDGGGNAYVTGWTDSSNFPLAGATPVSRAGRRDAFVARLNASGNGLVYATCLGGSADDSGNGIAVDAQGNAVRHRRDRLGESSAPASIAAGVRRRARGVRGQIEYRGNVVVCDLSGRFR